MKRKKEVVSRPTQSDRYIYYPKNVDYKAIKSYGLAEDCTRWCFAFNQSLSNLSTFDRKDSLRKKTIHSTYFFNHHESKELK